MWKQMGNRPLEYAKYGRGKRVLLLIPGFLGTSELHFGRILKDLSKAATIYAVETLSVIPNHNQWDASHPYAFPLFKDAVSLYHLMQRLEHERFTVIGYSYGGTTGAILAGLFPKKIDKLIMINSAHHFNDPWLYENISIQESLLKKSTWWKFLIHNCGETQLLKFLDDHRNFIQAENSHNVISRNMNNIFKDIVAKSLYIRSENDEILGFRHAQKFYDALKNLRIAQIPDVGHDITQQSDRILHHLQKFIFS